MSRLNPMNYLTQASDMDTRLGFGDMQAIMADPSLFGSPGTKDQPWSRTAPKSREWYEDWSATLGEVPENQIYPDTSSVGVLNADMITMINTAFSVEQTEYATWRDLAHMDENDGYVSTALDTIADAALGVERGGVKYLQQPFTIQVRKPRDETDIDLEAIPRIINDMCKRLDLHEQELWQIGRATIQFGNEFREVIIDDNIMSPYQQEGGGGTFDEPLSGCITRFDHRPSWQLWPKFDEKGNRIEGYTQKGRFQGKEQAIEFQEWQIVQFKVGKCARGKGSGLFMNVRRDWKKLQYLEEGLILARITRAYPKLVHKVPVAVQAAGDPEMVQAQIRNYQDSITRKRQAQSTAGKVDSAFNPTDVTTDYYVSKFFYLQPGAAPIETDIQVLEGSATHITDITDILHIRDKIITRSRVPRRYLGIEEKAGSSPQNASSDSEDVQFARVVRTLQRALTAGLKKLFNMELHLNGVLATDDDYDIVWSPISTMDKLTRADIMVKLGQAALQLQQVFDGGLTVDFLVRHVLEFQDRDQDSIVAEITRGQEEHRQKAMEDETQKAMAYNNPDAAEAAGYGPPSQQGEPREPQGGDEESPDEGDEPLDEDEDLEEQLLRR